MSKQKYDPKVYVSLRESINPTTGKPWTNYEIAAELDVDEASVRRGLRKARYTSHLVPQSVAARQRRLERPIVIDTAKAGAGAVTADWHHPLCDYSLVNVFIEQARDLKATNWLAVVGDWFNVDALSDFDYKQDGAGLEVEMLASTATMTAVLETFDKVYFSWGNHDARMHKRLGYKVDFKKAMRMLFEDLDPALLSRIEFSNLDHLFIDTPVNGRYRAAHPKAYSQVPLTTAIKLAAKYHTHILTGHSHHTALGTDRSGRLLVGELGGFFKTDVTEYLQRTTAFTEWVNGYGFMSKDGFFRMETPLWSNFIHERRGR